MTLMHKFMLVLFLLNKDLFFIPPLISLFTIFHQILGLLNKNSLPANQS